MGQDQSIPANDHDEKFKGDSPPHFVPSEQAEDRNNPKTHTNYDNTKLVHYNSRSKERGKNNGTQPSNREPTLPLPKMSSQEGTVSLQGSPDSPFANKISHQQSYIRPA